MRLDNLQISNKRIPIVLTVFVLMFCVGPFFFSYVYGWELTSPMERHCTLHMRYRMDVKTNETHDGFNPDGCISSECGPWNPLGYCSRFWGFGHPIQGEEDTVICAFQTCKKIGDTTGLLDWEDWTNEYLCEGGQTLKEIIDTARTYRTSSGTTGWNVRPCFIDLKDGGGLTWQEKCENQGGIPQVTADPNLHRCWQTDAVINSAFSDKTTCEENGGFWHAGNATWWQHNSCFIPQDLLMEINPWDPSVNCSVGGEEACMALWWFQRQSSDSLIFGVSLDIMNVPETPNSFNQTFSPCRNRGDYIPKLEWNYNHLGGLSQSAYQIRININSTGLPFDFDLVFPTDADDNPNFTGTELQWTDDDDPTGCFFTLSQPNCAFLTRAPSVTPNNSIEPDLDLGWPGWISDKWGSKIYWTVRVRDENGYWSEWSKAQNCTDPKTLCFDLPPNSYPWVDFIFEPPVAPVDTEVRFDPFFEPFSDRRRSHVFSELGFGPHASFEGPLRENWWGETWNLAWVFPSLEADIVGTWGESSHRHIVVFNEPSPGSGDEGFEVELTITDPVGMDTNYTPERAMSCTKEWSNVKIIWRLPEYREVAPVL